MPDILSSQKGGARAWVIWSLAATAFGFAFFQRVAPSVMVADLMRDFAFGGAGLGYLSALYFYPYVLLQIPLGALLDRLGARALLTAALTIAAAGSVLFGMAETLPTAYMGRFLIGAGAAVGFIASLALAAKWFAPQRFAFLAGLSMFFGMISGMMAQGPLALFIEQFGWRMSMIGAGGFAAVLALLVFVFVRNAPEKSAAEKAAPVASWGEVWTGLLRAARTREVWQIALVAMAMAGPMLSIGGLWGTPYLMSAYDLPRPEAAFYVSLMLLGWAIGAPFSGWLSDRIRRRKVLLSGFAALLTLCVALLVFAPALSLWLSAAAMALIGFSGAAMAITFALAREVTRPQINGSVTGIVNGMTVAAGAVLQPLVGLILDQVWNGALEQGSRVYQAQDYRLAFGLILAWAFAGFLMTLTLRETYARSIAEE